MRCKASAHWLNDLVWLFWLLSVLACIDLRDQVPTYQVKNQGGRLELTVMSFNILSNVDLAGLGDGYDRWFYRKDSVFRLIDETAPALVAVQECSPSQADQVRVHFGKRYEVVVNEGFSSDVLLLIERARFQLIQKGHWALENPLVPYKIRRLAVWAILRELASGREIVMVGVHLDAKDLKLTEAQLLREKLSALKESRAPLFLGGDFNASPGDAAYNEFVQHGWKDSFHAPEQLGELATYPFTRPSRRIDHIFYSGDDVHIESWRTAIGVAGIVASDHRPVIARFKIDAATL